MAMIFIRTLLSPLKARILYARKTAVWRGKNGHNTTTINEDCPLDVVSVGKGTYGRLNVHWYGNDAEHLQIGNYCSIAGEVHFILGGEHSYRRITNYPFSELTYHQGCDSVCKGPIMVEDDVWIGFGAIILSGVTLGRGCVIGAGSVVTMNVPPYAVFAGGRILKYRFNGEIVEKLMRIDYQNPDLGDFEKYCLSDIDENNVDDVLAAINPKK